MRFFHVARSFRGEDVLLDVHLTVERGELVLVTGAAGAGKSVLARLLLGFDTPRRGWVTVDGLVLGGSPAAALAAHRRRIAAIPQDAPLVGERSALDNVALAREVGGSARADALRDAALTLGRLGLDRLAERPAAALSRGERQWIAIARALVRSEAPLIVADEPGESLARADARVVGELLEQERAAGKTVIVFSRESSLPGTRAARSVALEGGRIAPLRAPVRRLAS